MADDGYLSSQLGAIGTTYLHFAQDKAEFARVQAERWAQIAKLEKEARDRKRADWRTPEQKRTPSGMSLKVSEILAEGANQHPEKER